MYYIWESEKYCLCDSKESEKASKFLREIGGITKSRELTCYGIRGASGRNSRHVEWKLHAIIQNNYIINLTHFQFRRISCIKNIYLVI